MKFVFALMFALGTLAMPAAAEDWTTPENCPSGGETCLKSCAQFEPGDEKFSQCEKSCRIKSNQVELEQCGDSIPSSPDAERPESPATATTTDSAANSDPEKNPQSDEPATPSPQIESKRNDEPQPRIRETLNAQGFMREQKLNERMQYAIRAGDFQTIRRLIKSVGLSPTYVDSYERAGRSGLELYTAKVSGLWLSEIFNANTSHTDASGVDHVLALFLELGMDVKAKIDSRTAWGPDFRTMESSKDRASRLRALDLALQAGLQPNGGLGEQLFTELPQICGRDKSQFAIQIVDVLAKNLGPSLKNSLQRQGEQGPESIDVLLDRSFSPHRPTNAREKELFAEQDERWENCQPLAHRIHRFIDKGK